MFTEKNPSITIDSNFSKSTLGNRDNVRVKIALGSLPNPHGHSNLINSRDLNVLFCRKHKTRPKYKKEIGLSMDRINHIAIVVPEIRKALDWYLSQFEVKTTISWRKIVSTDVIIIINNK